MKETPIIMSGNHPRLILDKLKTQTRRVMIPQPYERKEAPNCSEDWLWWPKSTDIPMVPRHEFRSWLTRCPYGRVGDILIIKEAWATENRYNHLKPSEIPRTAKIWYLSDEDYDPYVIGKTRSVWFMCHWMSRAKPEITEIRVERLQEITEKDAKAEGAICCPNTVPDYRHHFMVRWDSLNAKRGYGWETNPWDWALSFKLIKN